MIIRFLLIFSILVASNNVLASDAESQLPEPTGTYSVGYKFLEMTDSSREDPYNQGYFRKIKITIYYPSADVKKTESYGSEELLFWKRELTGPLEDKEITQKEFDSICKDLKNIVSFKSYDASLAKGPFPVIVFEHGFAVTAGSYQRMILDLVSHGYIVISTSHPYIADTVIFSDGSKSFIKAERDATLFETDFQDTQFLLSNIDNIAKQIESADVDKLGIIGHSLGAATAIKTTRINSLVKAGISLDPPISHITYEYDGDERIVSKLDDQIELDHGSNFDKPFLHIFAEKSMCDPSSVSMSENNFKAVVKGTEHNSFADHSFLKDNVTVFKTKGWYLGAGSANTLSYYPELNSMIRAFFDKFLKGAQVNLMQANSDVITITTTKD